MMNMSEYEDVTLYWPRGVRIWNTNTPYARGKIHDGERHGMWEFWYKNGRKQLQGEYIKGEKNGLWIKWTANGAKLSEVEFISGKMNGICTDWYENGQKALESMWVLGKRDGTWTYWNSDGTISKKETYNHRQEMDLGYSIHTDIEIRELVKKIQRENLARTWTRLVGPAIAKHAEPWQIACWLVFFISFFGLLKTKTQWKGVALAAILAFVTTSVITWALKKRESYTQRHK
jgi:hypothetical protein